MQTIKRIKYENILYIGALLFFVMFCGSIGSFLIFAAVWGGRIFPQITTVAMVSLAGILLCRKMAARFPTTWYIWGPFYALPLLVYGWLFGFSPDTVCFWRTIGVIVLLNALAGGYWGKQVSQKQ